MRQYLLDTPIVSAYLLRRPTAIQLLNPWIARGEATTSMLVYAEVNEYILGRPNYPDLHRQLRSLLRAIPPILLPYRILRRYGELRRVLRSGNSLIGDVDTLIAVSARDQNLTIVTADEDFRRVPNLPVLVIPRSQLTRQPSGR
jgi:predicted nucleic acid-binding protein